MKNDTTRKKKKKKKLKLKKNPAKNRLSKRKRIACNGAVFWILPPTRQFHPREINLLVGQSQ